MKSIQFILIALALAYASIFANAQNKIDSVKVTYKNKTVSILPQGDESYTTIRFKDTALDKRIVVRIGVVNNSDYLENKLSPLDSNSKKVINMLKPQGYGNDRKHFIETSFIPTFDIGLTSTMNETENMNVLNPKMGKSANINIGLVRQNMNLIKGQLLLSYGININNYYLKYNNKQMVQYLDAQGSLKAFIDTVNNYDKNRLDIRYLAVPVLLEFHTKNNKFNIAAGVEFGFNGHSKVVLKGDHKSLEFKQKNDNDISVNPSQMSAILKIGFDDIAVYGKYTITDMYQGAAYAQGLNPHQHLYSIGICLFGI